MNKEFDMLVVDLYGRMQSCQKVGRRLNVSPSTVHRALTRSGVKLPPRGDESLNQRKRKLSGDALHGVALAYARGDSMRNIQAVFGCGQVAVYSALRIAGVKRRPRGQQPRELTTEEKNEIVRLRIEENLSQAVIAAKVGCHQGTVSNHLRSCGIFSRSSTVGHGSWKGGIVKLSGGYVGVLAKSDWPYRSMINSAGYIAEHRMVMAQHLGRPLDRHETVHHKDGNRQNNSLDNLQLRSGKHGKGCVMPCRACGSHDIQSEDI